MDEHIKNIFKSNSTFTETFDELFYNSFKLNKFIEFKDIEKNIFEITFDKIKKKIGTEDKQNNFSSKKYKIIGRRRTFSLLYDILSFKSFEDMFNYSISINFINMYHYFALFIEETNLSNLDFDVVIVDKKKHFVFYPTDMYYLNVNNRHR